MGFCFKGCLSPASELIEDHLELREASARYALHWVANVVSPEATSSE